MRRAVLYTCAGSPSEHGVQAPPAANASIPEIHDSSTIHTVFKIRDDRTFGCLIFRTVLYMLRLCSAIGVGGKPEGRVHDGVGTVSCVFILAALLRVVHSFSPKSATRQKNSLQPLHCFSTRVRVCWRLCFGLQGPVCMLMLGNRSTIGGAEGAVS